MSTNDNVYVPVSDDDARKVPVRVALVQDEARFAVSEHDEPKAMSMPHLFLREAIALLALLLSLVLLSLLVDAPLEQIANPGETPNPAKAILTPTMPPAGPERMQSLPRKACASVSPPCDCMK